MTSSYRSTNIIIVTKVISIIVVLFGVWILSLSATHNYCISLSSSYHHGLRLGFWWIHDLSISTFISPKASPWGVLALLNILSHNFINWSLIIKKLWLLWGRLLWVYWTSWFLATQLMVTCILSIMIILVKIRNSLTEYMFGFNLLEYQEIISSEIGFTMFNYYNSS